VKGDKIMVRLATGSGQTCVETVTASKAGRTVRQRWSGKWVYVEEMTRTHKVVGGSLRVLASAVLVVADVRGEPPTVPATAKGYRADGRHAPEREARLDRIAAVYPEAAAEARAAGKGQYESELDQPGHVPGEFTSGSGTLSATDST